MKLKLGDSWISPLKSFHGPVGLFSCLGTLGVVWHVAFSVPGPHWKSQIIDAHLRPTEQNIHPYKRLRGLCMHTGAWRPNGFSSMFSWALPSQASSPDALLHFPKVSLSPYFVTS